MGGEGAMMQANQMNKYNKGQLSKRKDRKWSIVGEDQEKPEFNLPGATPEILEKIKQEMKIKNKEIRIKRLILLILFMGVILASLAFVLMF